MPISVFELVVALVVTALGAIVQGTIGVGFGMLSVPVLSLVNPVLAPVPQLLLAAPLALSSRSTSSSTATGALSPGRLPAFITRV